MGSFVAALLRCFLDACQDILQIEDYPDITLDNIGFNDTLGVQRNSYLRLSIGVVEEKRRLVGA